MGKITDEEAYRIAKHPTGITSLDQVLLGGLPEGRVTVLGGGHGTGKTVLTLECLYRQARAGEPGIFVTFEERASAIRENLRAMGWDLQSLEDSGKLAIIAINLPPDIVLSGDFNLDGALAIIRHKAKEIGARLLVLDAVDWLLNLFEEPSLRTKHLLSLHASLRDQKLTTIVTVKEHERDASMIDYIADCVIRLDQRVEKQINTRRLRVSKYRGSAFLGNEHPYLITDKGIQIMSISALSLSYDAPTRRISTGNRQLDEVLEGGYFQGSSVLIAGASGTGKTILASTFTEAACAGGDRVLYVSFEESAEALVQAMRSPGIDLQPHLDSGRLRLTASLPESKGTDLHLLRILNAIDDFSPTHLVVDAVSAMQRIGTAQAAFDFQASLIYICKNRGITCLLTTQVRTSKITREMGQLEISSLGECVITLEQEWSEADFTRRISVIKSRGSGHSNGVFSFRITSHGLVIEERGHRDDTRRPRPSAERGH